MRQRQLFILFLLLFTSQAVVFAQGTTLSGFSISYNGRAFNASANNTTFTYTVAGTNVPPELTQFSLQIPVCQPALETVAYAPTQGVSFGTDATTSITGIRWDLPLAVGQSRVYTVTLAGEVSEGTVNAAVKSGTGFQVGQVQGPSCTEAAIRVVKFVSVDNRATWVDAEIPTGPVVPVGTPVSFRYQITNNGDFTLENVTLTDSDFDISSCGVSGTLNAGASVECMVGPFPAVEGQHSNTATVTGTYSGRTYTDTDLAHYYAGTLPRLTVEKMVGLAGGGTWYTADSAPGLLVPDDDRVSFRFVVTNEGTESFTNITLTDSLYSTASCQIPAELRPTQSFECIIGPFDVDDDANGNGNHDDDDDDDTIQSLVNTLTVTAVANGQTVTVTDQAHYQVDDDDDDDDTIIIIEGPVDVIINNIIIIYGIEIEMDDDDPLLTVIRVGDNVRVQGNVTNMQTGIVVVAVVIVVIDVDIYIVDNLVWRDDGDCRNAPPPWAPAHGWRQKCIIVVPDVRPGWGNNGGGGNNDDDDDGGDDDD
jgi:hypothetical protein